MMYSEFLKGTGAPENSKTYEQFLKIEQIYMDCNHMSKEKAYRLWKSTYGKEAKLARKKREERINRLAMPEEQYQELPEPDQSDTDGTGFLYQMFLYELDNHEYGYTGDLEDTLDCLGLTWEELKASPVMLKALDKASTEIREREGC